MRSRPTAGQAKPQIAVFAAVDLIESEWGSPETGPVRVHSKWRVFHLGSGETELLASSNYGERAAWRCRCFGN